MICNPECCALVSFQRNRMWSPEIRMAQRGLYRRQHENATLKCHQTRLRTRFNKVKIEWKMVSVYGSVLQFPLIKMSYKLSWG
jgi:hypothetical protein